MSKCPHCGKVPYPAKNEDGSWNWKNIFRIDWMSVLFVLLVLFLAWSYQHDTEKCQDIVKNPHKYCDAYCDTRPFGGLEYELPGIEKGAESTSIPRFDTEG